MYKEQYPEQEPLTKNELDRLVALFVDQSKGTLFDVVKTTEFGTINELDSEFAKINITEHKLVSANIKVIGEVNDELKK